MANITTRTRKPKETEVSQAERKQILEEATPEFKEQYELIQTYLKDEIQRTIKGRYELGKIALDLSKDPDKYGKKSLENMSKLIKLDHSILSRCKVMAERFDEEEINYFITARNVEGDPLTYSHIALIAQVPEKTVRDLLIQDSLDNSWTYVELEQKVHEKSGVRSKGGRKHKVPKTFDGYLVNIDTMVTDLSSKAENVWLSADNSLYAMLDNFDLEKISPDQVNKVEQVREMVTMAQTNLGRLARELDRVQVRLEREKTTTKKDEDVSETGGKNRRTKREPAEA